MPIGVHTSTAGGISRSVARATELECTTMQVFVSSPRTWKADALKDSEVRDFKKFRKEAELAPIVVHTSYLINLATPSEEAYEKSKKLFTDELRIAKEIKAEYIVTHPGSFHDEDEKFGIKRVAMALMESAKSIKGKLPVILIENTAGGGTQIGGKLSNIGKIIKASKGVRVGLCYDTCHGFAAGYPFNTKKDGLKLISEIDEGVGLKNLKVIHLNDSKGECGSKVDRHEHLGKGKLGGAAMASFLSDKRVREIPLILETPKSDDDADTRNLKEARKLQRSKKK
ncbi:MAG: deoxyribonuclease IV [Deltaproteobacteria bacterium]|nr:deoxyribonuclease IV [Deltaproteobacteria bacterium]